VIVDAYALIALLRDEAAGVHVEALLRSNPQARLTSVGVAEVLDRLIRLTAVDEDEAVLDLATVGLMAPTVVSSIVASAAGRLRARRYHRTRCAISLADCIVAETARAHECAVATSDPHLLDVCGEVGHLVHVVGAGAAATADDAHAAIEPARTQRGVLRW